MVSLLVVKVILQILVDGLHLLITIQTGRCPPYVPKSESNPCRQNP